MQELAQFGQPDGVSITFANGTYSVLLAASNPGLSLSGGLHLLVVSGAGLSVGGSGLSLSPFVASGASHAPGGVPDPGAVAGTTKFLREDSTWQLPPTGVTSVGLSMPAMFAVSGSPVTSAGTLTVNLVNQNQHFVFAAPANALGVPSFRALVPGDYPVFVASGASHAAGAVPDPGSTAGTSKFLREDATWQLPPVTSVNGLTGAVSVGTVTSVALGAPGMFTVSGSPVTASGTLTLALANQNANLVFAGPASGAAAAPTFRSLVAADLPALYALRNRVINGNFDFWQRGTSFNFPANVGYYADRWHNQGIGGGAPTGTISRIALNPGDLGTTTPATYALQWNQTAVASSGNPTIEQRIENSLTLGGQAFTLSFWGKCSSGTVSVQPLLRQIFQVSGIVDTFLAAQTFTTTWQRFTISGSLPSVVGKSVGAGDYLGLQFLMPNGATFTVQFAQVQLEPGSVATDFEYRPPTLELLLCQRYYERSYSLTQANGTNGVLGPAICPNTISSLAASTAGNVGEGTFLGFVVEKRATPTIVLYAFDGTINGCHCENPGAGTAAERNGATAGPVNAKGALQYVTFDATGAFAISKQAILFAHWTAEAEL